uniref:Uncharacterized protein n=1 Tax=Mycobacterium riyadhense TaxID=486698 RepID=A0A653EPM1_9MYCO|nr:hypothetical protein BIN_B_02644 [Mycobacterium riyadhense]
MWTVAFVGNADGAAVLVEQHHVLDSREEAVHQRISVVIDSARARRSSAALGSGFAVASTSSAYR